MKPFIAAGLLVAAFAPAAIAQSSNETLIRNATVLTITRGVIENGSVLVRDGKIAAVGPASEVRASSTARVIDATGRYVMPGIIDTHSHAGVEGQVNEGALPNTGMVRIADVLNPEDPDAYRQLAGGTTAANILHGSANAIGGQNAIAKWKWGRPVSEWVIADAPKGIKFALGENPKSSNVPVTPNAPRQYPNTRMGVEEVIRNSFAEARDYKLRWDDYNARRKRGEDVIAPRRDILMDTMLGILDGSIHVHSHCYRSDEIYMLIRLAEEYGFKVRTFQHVLEGYKVAPEIARHGAGAGTFIDWWGFKAEAYDGIPHNVAMMARNGVLVSVNSDSSDVARRLNLDAAKAMKYGGLSEEEALKTCTINAAEQLGIAHRVGSIEVGKDADLVIWSEHPFSTYARADLTMIEGVVYFDRVKDLETREQLRREKEQLLAQEKASMDAEKKKKPADDKKAVR